MSSQQTLGHKKPYWRDMLKNIKYNLFLLINCIHFLVCKLFNF